MKLRRLNRSRKIPECDPDTSQTPLWRFLNHIKLKKQTSNTLTHQGMSWICLGAETVYLYANTPPQEEETL